MSTITQKYLREILHYDMYTGVLSNRIDHGKAEAGFVHQAKNTTGRIAIRVKAQLVLAHRVTAPVMADEVIIQQHHHRGYYDQPETVRRPITIDKHGARLGQVRDHNGNCVIKTIHGE
ncbi:hypothetical protein [Rhizobium sp. RAF56]|uniref:hypothetical protein n=1 Tax=Rhizobium sp. RAF56 TaxID=3233062 RepID=UPI003F9A105D